MVVVTARTRVEEVVEAMRCRAYDYLAKPIDPLRFEQTLRRAVEHGAMKARVRRLEDALGERSLLDTLAAHGAAMREVARSVERVRHADVNVAIMGESGTGKELVARAIHDGGWTRAGAFVAVNCASIPHSIQESSSSATRRGPSPGPRPPTRASSSRPPGARCSSTRSARWRPPPRPASSASSRSGSSCGSAARTEIPVDARVVCATHRDLGAEVKAGRFREDLYFRLVVYPIRLPPLRERLDDLPLLVAELLSRSRIARDRGIRVMRPEALAVLSEQRWPGNVRELDNVIQRACLACTGDELDVHAPPPGDPRPGLAEGAAILLPRRSRPRGSRPAAAVTPVVSVRAVARSAPSRATPSNRRSTRAAATSPPPPGCWG